MKLFLALFVLCLSFCLSSTEQTCSNGFQLINKTCWCLVKQSKNYNDAEKMCRLSDGAVVVEPKTIEENTDLVDLLNTFGVSKIWMGLICRTTKISDCQWDNVGHLDGYSNFVDGSPNGKDRCVHFEVSLGKKWFSTDCNAVTLPFVCQLPPTEKDCHSKCDSKYNNHCYNLYKTPKTFDDAEKTCQSENPPSHLVSINNYLEYRFVAQMYRKQGHYWIGGHMSNDTDKTITWVDGSTDQYSLKGNVEDGNCVQYDVDGDSLGGYYNGRNCNLTSIFICKRPASC